MSNLLRVTIIAASLCIPGPLLADAGADADKTYQSCLDNSDDSQDMIDCAYAAQDDWNKILNANYQAAMATLNKQRRQALRKAQRAWLKYRDADSEFRDAAWQFGDALDAKLFLTDAGVDVIKQRAQLLGTFFEASTQN